MPELPEVETVRKGLEQLVKGKIIANVRVLWRNIVTVDGTLEAWCQSLRHQCIQALQRRGKYLIFELDNQALISHLRMEGKFHYYSTASTPSKHVHAIFEFSDGSQLHYEDVRKFGRFETVALSDVSHYFAQKQLGPEPIETEFEREVFQQQLSKIRRAIKPVLLEQKVVVGLGNIYVDEALFRAKIHPEMPANQLNSTQVAQLHVHIMAVLSEAVEAGGSTIRSYLNSLGEAGTFQVNLAVYGKTNQPCIVCQTPITKIKVAQRGTHFCPKCQCLPQ